MKTLRLKVTWGEDVIWDVAKDFETKIDGYRELAWVFRSAMEMVEGKDIGVDWLHKDAK